MKKLIRLVRNSFDRKRKPRRRLRPSPFMGIEELETRILLSGDSTAIPGNDPPAISQFQLKNDTGSSSTDKITSDPTVEGTVTNDGDVSYLAVQIDTDADGTSNVTVTTNSQGHFYYDPTSDLTYGNNKTVKARAVEFDESGDALYSDWNSLSFDYQNDKPTIETLKLKNDNGVSNSDKITTDGTIEGTVGNDGSVANLVVQIDLDNDGSSDVTAVTDSTGYYSFETTPHVPPGNVTVKVRVVEFDAYGNTLYSQWSTLDFVLVSDAEVASVGLQNDTGRPGDQMTSDATITGSIGGTGVLEGIVIELDLDGDGVTDVTTTTDSNGNYTIDLAPYLSYGQVTIAAKTEDGSSWMTLSFLYLPV